MRSKPRTPRVVIALFAQVFIAVVAIGCGSKGEESQGKANPDLTIHDRLDIKDSCTSSQIKCMGTCYDPNTSNSNCGSCGNACTGGKSCTTGICCSAGQSNCSGACASTLTDTNNCGTCGNKCASGQSCTSGACVGCASGLTSCSGVCVNTNTDAKNCGACALACANGNSCCSGGCSDTSSDNNNCGACGVVCSGTSQCSAGLCCASGLANCSNVCVNTLTDTLNCGVCGKKCASGQTCTAGVCTGGDAGADSGSGSSSGGSSSGSSGSSGSSSSSSSGGGSSNGSFGPSICANDPCNPYCSELDTPDANLTPDSMTGTTTTTVTTTVTAYQGSTDGFGGCPPGFHSKEVNPSGCVTGGVPDYSQCNTDYHCDTASGQCVRSQPGWSYPASVCSGINLTISGACTDANGNTTMPLCNRGNTTLKAANYPLGVSYYLVNGNHFDFNCPTYNPPTGYLPLTQDLAPGQCVNVWPGGVHGNTIMYINATNAIPECGAFGGSNNAPGCYDNWADVKVGGTCQPQTEQTQTTATIPAYATSVYTATTTATCPSGTSPQWSVFTYDATVPSNASGTSSMLIQAQTAPVSPYDGGIGSYGPLVTFANTASPTNDPAVCGYVGATGSCPKDAFGLLGGLPAAGYGSLKLQITLKPTPDGQAMPTVIGWQVAYSCKPSE